MDAATEKNCLEELTMKLIDQNEKISQRSISNLYMVHYNVARDLLQKLLDLHKGSIVIVKEFWISGWNSEKEYRISMVSEDVKNKLEKLLSNFDASLYSLASEAGAKSKNYHIHDGSEIKMKAITLDVGHRNLEIISVVQEPQIKQEPKKAKPAQSLFKSTLKTVDKKPNIKKTETDNSPPSTSKSDEKKEQPKTTQKVSSPSVVKKTPSGKAKGSIASFFSAKPATSGSKSSTSKPMEIAPRTEKTPEKELKKIVKIESSEEDVKKSPEAPKQQIKKKTNLKAKKTVNNKRSRIMQLEDSSDEDKEKDDDEDEEPEAKLIKFDREVTPEPNSNPEPTNVEKSAEKPSAKIRMKARRTVCRTYEDEDGFINTVREVEEYSTSETEEVTAPVAKENEKPNKKPVEVVQVKVSPTAKVHKKQQGSIMNFFTKK